MIVGDMEPFKSPITGETISGRAAYREHCKRFNVTNPADYTNQWERQRQERERAFTPKAGYDRERRIERIKHAYEKLSRR